MGGVLLAESAILLHLETIGVILLVLHRIVVSLLALGASQSDFNAHNGTSLKIASLYHPGYEKFSKRLTTIAAPRLKNGRKKISPFFTGEIILPQGGAIVNNFFAKNGGKMQKISAHEQAVSAHILRRKGGMEYETKLEGLSGVDRCG